MMVPPLAELGHHEVHLWEVLYLDGVLEGVLVLASTIEREILLLHRVALQFQAQQPRQFVPKRFELAHVVDEVVG
jgi:hypothetical protein